MMAKDSSNHGAWKPWEPVAGGEVRLRATAPKPVQVKHHAAPPRHQLRERIHPRRILPKVREGKEREFHSVNTGLPEPGQQQLAANVDQPSMAASDAAGAGQPPVQPPAPPATPPPAPPVPPGPLPPTPPTDGDPITDVNTLSVVSPAVAAEIKAAAGLAAGVQAAGAQPAGALATPLAPSESAAPPQPLDVPGTERWPVKTGQDQDRAKVGKNVIDGVDLGAGIVEATIEELVSLPRPPGLEDATKDPPQFQSVRDGVGEVTIWRIEATIIALKHEHDGDYHLVLQSASGQEMVAEIPTPTTDFVGDSPWIGNIGQTRQEVDDKLVKQLSPAAFALWNDKYVPHGALTFQPGTAADPALSFVTPSKGSGIAQPLFQTAVAPTPARITGVGFFDRAHGATGAAPNVIELHPVLKVEWL
jgi:hypothetical protein